MTDGATPTTVSLAIGHYLRLFNDSDALTLALQNFSIGQNKVVDGVTYIFSPFGFSGMSTNRQGELSPATIVFPNTDLSRGYLDSALRGGTIAAGEFWRTPYIGEVDVNILNPADGTVVSTLFTYTGQSTGGGWTDTKLTLELSSVLDAVTGDIPTRTLQRRLVGSLPTSATIRLR